MNGIKLDSSNVRQALDELARRKQPAATREALQKVSFDIREEAAKELGRSGYDFVSPSVRAFFTKPSSFRFNIRGSGQRIVSTIHATDATERVFGKQATGAVLSPKSGRFAIPARKFGSRKQTRVKKTTRGIATRDRPKRLLETGRGFVRDDVLFSAKTGKALFFLERRVRIDRTFRFFRVVARTANRNFAAKVRRALEKRTK